jgi:hypothetical protein
MFIHAIKTLVVLQSCEGGKMKGLHWYARTVVLIASLMLPTLLSAVTIRQIHAPADSTTPSGPGALLDMPLPASSIDLPASEPAGDNNNAMLTAAAGQQEPRSGLAVTNLREWEEYYLAAGAISITLDTNYLDTADLALRLLLTDPMDDPPRMLAFSARQLFLATGR